MELLMQPASSTYGQACIAMITGKSVEEVIRDMHTDGPESCSLRVFYFNSSYKCRLYTLDIVV